MTPELEATIVRLRARLSGTGPCRLLSAPACTCGLCDLDRLTARPAFARHPTVTAATHARLVRAIQIAWLSGCTVGLLAGATSMLLWSWLR